MDRPALMAERKRILRKLRYWTSIFYASRETPAADRASEKLKFLLAGCDEIDVKLACME